MGLREQKRIELRRAIVDAAIRLFRQKGYDATQVREIARRARISEATFFNHFASKQALLDQFTLETVESYAALLHHELLEEERPVPMRIREVVMVSDRVSPPIVSSWRSSPFARTCSMGQPSLRANAI